MCISIGSWYARSEPETNRNKRTTLETHSLTHSLDCMLKKWVRLLFIHKMIQSEGVMCYLFLLLARFFSVFLSLALFSLLLFVIIVVVVVVSYLLSSNLVFLPSLKKQRWQKCRLRVVALFS